MVKAWRISPAETHCEIALAECTGQRDAGHVQPADDDKEQVEQDVQHASDGQVHQRLFGLTDGAEYRVAEVVKREGRHTEEVDPQIEDGTRQQIVLGVQQAKQRRRTQQTNQQQNDASNGTDDNGRVNGFVHIIRVTGTVKAGHQHIDAVAQADEKTGEQGDKDAGGTHRTQCC